MAIRKNRQRRSRGNAIAEFGPALWFFFILILLPLLDLASFMWGVGTVMMVANLGCRKAAGANTWTLASGIVTATEADLANFRSYASVVPITGNSGVTLNVLAYPTSGTGTVTTYAPPPLPNKIKNDRTTLDSTIYDYQVVASYNVQPLFNFKGMPFFSSIPGLGAPVPITFTSTCNVEHPEGLNN
jgi:hypothetical protein